MQGTVNSLFPIEQFSGSDLYFFYIFKVLYVLKFLSIPTLNAAVVQQECLAMERLAMTSTNAIFMSLVIVEPIVPIYRPVLFVIRAQMDLVANMLMVLG